MKYEKLISWLETVYVICFMVGVRSVRCLKTLVRFTRLLWVPIAHALRRLWNWLVWRHVQALYAEYRVHGWRKASRTARNILLPITASVLLVITIQYWAGAEFVLALSYNGKPIGYIADEGVYAEAATIVRDSVINADESFVVEQSPAMRVEVLKTDTLLQTQEVSNRILQAVDSELISGVGLYVDGVFRGALTTRAQLDAAMDSVLSKHKTPLDDGVGFLHQVQLAEGIYPVSALTTLENITNHLNALTVKTMRNLEYTETVKYKTVYQETDTLPLGYESVQVRGKNGSRRVFAQQILVDGKKRYQTVVATQMIKAPVDRVVLIGAQKYNDKTQLGDGKATGVFIWPLPYTKQISSFFTNRWGVMHGAIDIANGSTNGKPIIASDGGTVVEAQYHNSWGNYVLIDHGNGFKTRYAHCSKLDVKVGDKVAQGQYIAKVGNTGYSTGPHLHFEVIKNGVLVNPLNYVKR